MKVIQLLLPICGLKQSGCNWKTRAKIELSQLDFKSLGSGFAVYFSSKYWRNPSLVRRQLLNAVTNSLAR